MCGHLTMVSFLHTLASAIVFFINIHFGWGPIRHKLFKLSYSLTSIHISHTICIRLGLHPKTAFDYDIWNTLNFNLFWLSFNWWSAFVNHDHLKSIRHSQWPPVYLYIPHTLYYQTNATRPVSLVFSSRESPLLVRCVDQIHMKKNQHIPTQSSPGLSYRHPSYSHSSPFVPIHPRHVHLPSARRNPCLS